MIIDILMILSTLALLVITYILGVRHGFKKGCEWTFMKFQEGLNNVGSKK